MRIAVYGSGGHGKVVSDILLAREEHEVVGYLDDNPRVAGDTVGGLRVFAVEDSLNTTVNRWRIEGVSLGIGDNVARYRVAQRCRKAGLSLVPAVHPRSTVARSVRLDQGIAIMGGAVLNPFVTVEEGAVINTAASVDHDCHIGSFAQVWPGAHLAGGVEVGEFSYIGMGASIIQNVRVGRHVTVGAGAVVLHDLDDGVTAVGVPARTTRVKNLSEVP